MSMLMVSSIFVILYVLLVEIICVGYALFIYICIDLGYKMIKRGNIWIQLTGLIPPNVCAGPKQESAFPMPYFVIVFVFNGLWCGLKVCFVDFGGIGDYRCLINVWRYKRVFRSRKVKTDRQYNDKMTNNDLQNTIQKTKDWTHGVYRIGPLKQQDVHHQDIP